MCNHNVPATCIDFNVYMAADVEKKSLENISPEESSLIKAISLCLISKMENMEDAKTLKNCLRDMFPQSSRPKSASLGYPRKLVTTIEDHLKEANLQVSQDLVDKVCLLNLTTLRVKLNIRSVQFLTYK